jgi:glycosyltransferase involved in cell wall biosynthesis
MYQDRISIIVPVFNNEESLAILIEEINSAVSSITPSVALEVILVDDGSTDNSWREISKLSSAQPEVVKGVKLTRNFGQLAAMIAGWELCKGDAIINISADLQDPPSQIPKFIGLWRDGFHVVIGVRTNRTDGLFARVTSKIAHKILQQSNPRFPKTWFDYTLMSRKNLEVVMTMSGRYRFVQGDIFFAGFDYATVSYTRAKRIFGRSGYNFWKRFANFTDSVLDSSYFIIQIFIRFGFIFSSAAIIYALWIIIARLTGLIPSTGWAPIMVVLLLCSGLIMSMLGIIAEYLWRIYDSTRNKPTYLIDRQIP